MRARIKKLRRSLTDAFNYGVACQFGRDSDDVRMLAADAAGLHAARVQSAPIAVRSRAPHLAYDHIRTSLLGRRVIKLRTVRGTLHYYDVNDALPFHVATLSRRLSLCRNIMGKVDVSERVWANVNDAIVASIGVELLTSREIETRVARSPRLRALGVKRIPAIRAALKHLWEQGVLFSENAAEAFGAEVRRFGQTQIHFPALDLTGDMDVGDATVRMFGRYVETYGPVSIEDAAWWSGFSPLAVARAFEGLGDAIVEVALRDAPAPMYMHRDRLDAFVGHDCMPFHGINFIAHEESLLKAYRQTRCRYVSDAHYNILFNQIGEARSCVLVDGRIAATWLWISAKNAIDVRFFESCAPSVARRVEEEAEVLRRTITVLEAQSLPLFSSDFENESSRTTRV